MSTFTITPRGPFSLREAATFGFGQREAEPYEGLMRLAFCVDGYRGQAAAEVSQDGDGVQVRLQADPGDREAAEAQVARVLSLDHDGDAFTGIGRRDPVIGRLQAVAPGLRPPLSTSPYEAAAWTVLSARRTSSQAAAVRRRLSEAHGATFEVAGRPMAAFPLPERLLAVAAFAGIDDTRWRRLHGVATAALDGRLDAAALMAMGPDRARAELQRLDGIGPFYSALVVVRGTGFVDVVPGNEPKLLALVGSLYGLGGPATADQLMKLAEDWRPMRTWAAVLVRAATARLPPAAA